MPAMPAAAATSSASATAVDTAPAEGNDIGHVLVSIASELTGNAQTCRNELFFLFDIWMPWADKNLPKPEYQAQEETLRDQARRLLVFELSKLCLRVEYQAFDNGTTSVSVIWDEMRMEREVKKDGRSAARNAFVALLRKRVKSGLTKVMQWPFPDRPKTDPVHDAQGAEKLYDAALQLQIPYISWSGVAHRPAIKLNAPAGSTASQPATGAPPKLKAPCDTGGALQSRWGIQGPGSVALLVVLETNEDIQNVYIWLAWLMEAPRKGYTVYVYAEDPASVRHPLFRDLLVNPEIWVEPPSAISETAAAATSKPPLIVLLQKALEEPSNQWFVLLNSMCLPMVHPNTFHGRMAAHPPTSVFNLYPERVQAAMLEILKLVSGLPLLVREAIETQSLRACAQTGTILVRADAKLLAAAQAADVREWQEALNSGAMQKALYSTRGRQCIRADFMQPPGVIGHAPVLPSMHLSDNELFLHAFLHRLRRQHGVAADAACKGTGEPQRMHKLVHMRCCLAQGDCECCFSRRLRPAKYRMLCEDFVDGCAFAQNVESLFAVTTRDMQTLWSLDAYPEHYLNMVRSLALPCMSKRALPVPLPVGVPGDVAVDAVCGAVPKYELTRHDCGRDVWMQTSGGRNNVLLKLRRHIRKQCFRVQYSPDQSDRDLPEIDFAHLDFSIVTSQVSAAPNAVLGIREGEPAAVSVHGLTAEPVLGGFVAAPEMQLGIREGEAVAVPPPAPVAKRVLVEFRKNFDVDQFRQYAEELAGVTMKSTALHRLHDLFRLIYRPDAPVEDRQMDQEPRKNCVLGFSQLEVKQPQFNNEIRELVKTNKLWHGLSGCRELKKPTLVVYELLRQIGVHPQKHSRGPKEHDPDPKDFVYATRYIFRNDTLLKNRHRLQVPSCA
jgi:hypothetical protein